MNNDTLFIHGIAVDVVIGVHPQERLAARPIIIDVELGVDGTKVSKQDTLTDTLDYEAVVALIRNIAASSHYQLVEALAAEITRQLQATFSPRGLRLRVHKPDAIAGVRVVGVEIERGLHEH